MPVDYTVHAGKETITVKFPSNKPLFGWKSELGILLGVPIREKSPVEMIFSWKIDSDSERINSGLKTFIERHPGTFVYPGDLS